MSAPPSGGARRPAVPAEVLAVAVVAAGVVGLIASTAVGAAQIPDDGAGLYRVACASCHGSDGTGVDPSRVAFDVPLPDLTDCSFASREPDADWIAVAHQGGPVRGFDRVMPAFGEALDEVQLQRIMDHIRTFCTDARWPRGELNLPRPMFTEKAYPEDEAVWTTGIALDAPGEIETEFLYEKRFGPRSMIEVALPIAVAQGEQEGPWSAGVGDVALGVKHTFFHDLEAGSIAAVGGEILLPTGSDRRGLGSGVTRFEPYLAFGQSMPSDSFVQLHGGLELSTDPDRVEHEVFWRAAIGRTWTQGDWGRAWTPMVEVLGARDLESGALTDWALAPQVQVTLNTRQHVMLDVALELPLNRTELRSTRLLVYLLWDWFDGGLFQGW